MSDDGTSAIDDFLLDLTGKNHPRVCFLPTASGDVDGYSQRFEAAFASRAETSVLSLFCHDPWGYTEPKMLLEQDIIYVGGGSTANLLALWRLHGLPAILAEAAAHGAILAGVSAGMNCWFEGSSTDSFGPLAPLADGSLGNGYAVDEYAAILFRDGEFVEALAEKPERTVVRVEHNGSHRAAEIEIPVRGLQ